MDTFVALPLQLPLHGPEPEPQPNVFRVVHPLDDEPEKKFDPDGLGPMRMGHSVKVSLLLLRFYLVAMIALVGYRVVELALVTHTG
jgi:hypothetical protein